MNFVSIMVLIGFFIVITYGFHNKVVSVLILEICVFQQLSNIKMLQSRQSYLCLIFGAPLQPDELFCESLFHCLDSSSP